MFHRLRRLDHILETNHSLEWLSHISSVGLIKASFSILFVINFLMGHRVKKKNTRREDKKKHLQKISVLLKPFDTSAARVKLKTIY